MAIDCIDSVTVTIRTARTRSRAEIIELIIMIQLLCNKNDIIEDTPLRPSILSALKSILLQSISTLLFLPLSLVCLPLYITGLIIWGRPPTISPWSRFYRYFIAAWTEGKPEEGIPFTNRILLFVIIFDYLIKSPIKGIGWFLDEILYSSYHKCEIKQPLFFISAGRSGSTQMAEYLEDDEENFITPMMIEVMFPYIWAWKMIAPILKMIGFKKYFESPSYYGEEMKKYHNINLFKSETLEVPVGIGHNIMGLASFALGASFFKRTLTCSVLKNQPVDREFCKIILEFIYHIMKKVMYHRGLSKQRMFIKLHSLLIAKELEQRYYGVKFLTIVRDPVERIHSGIIFLRVATVEGPIRKKFGLFPPPLRVVRDCVIETQTCYCEEEMIFYNQSKENVKNRLAISFNTYVKNLVGTLQRVYLFLNIPMSAELLSKAAALQKSSHDRTKRKSTYDPKYNRSLSSVGVDEEKLKEYLADYTNWMNRLE